MPKVAQNHKNTSSVASETSGTTRFGGSSESNSRPPVTTRPTAPTEAELEELGFFDTPDLEQVEDDEHFDWRHRKKVFRLDNGVVLIAASEIEAAAYANKGATLVDVIDG